MHIYPLFCFPLSSHYVDKWLSPLGCPSLAGSAVRGRWLGEAFQGQREDHSSMAVDDVKITMLSCDTLGTCTCTYGSCGWQNVIAGEELTDETDWLVGSGVTGTDLDAPEKDHNGDREALFLYMMDSKYAETGRATLQSQMFVPDKDSNLCFHFWYYLKPDDRGDAEDASRKEVWRQDVLSGFWEEGQVHVKAGHFLNAEAYQVTIGLVFCSCHIGIENI
ncbi:MAM and LDL-receptor class A domain-containing protein 2 [Chionoecetes opilio]|uniref:MAM and LDL-receptor class A domain-containing protein 2 n=1 Tax=Chionoecetes opilio TaxID=41210 RepID=A0A8J5D1A7_CHIOP|nr:MAM and LDL-receptor class A domain-containing protein 2 [Chionoecetes opilio]